ncbi:hypothetical protein ACFV3R_03935 [Streptomyces sp. NPDC059740]|uniref:hypothetical protein n=1 Tax=Streptomyces sp. NPDC059740 TaxID=3346926 RepID=UPI00365C6F44
MSEGAVGAATAVTGTGEGPGTDLTDLPDGAVAGPQGPITFGHRGAADAQTAPADGPAAVHPPGQAYGPLDAGRDEEPCDLVTVPARQGLEAVDILRLRDVVGAVLHDGSCDTLGFLVPAGTAEGWDLPGSACTQTHGRGLSLGEAVAAAAGPPEPPVAGTGWLVPPDGARDQATDPAVLREALGRAARTIEALDAM